MHEALMVFLGAVSGSLVGCCIGCVPALHAYSVLGVCATAFHRSGTELVHTELAVSFTVGVICAWSMVNAIPSILLSAPDESAVLTVLPGRRYVAEGRGMYATLLVGTGSLAGLIITVLLAGSFAPLILGPLSRTFTPHMHWILWSVIVFMILSEWPKTATHARQGGWCTLAVGLSTPAAGLLTFLLSGLLGFILRYRTPVNTAISFQNLGPAFIGLFAVPWLLQNMVSRETVPEQKEYVAGTVGSKALLKGALSGTGGGLFAAFFPGVTGGIGGLLAGHATSLRDDHAFLISQGTSKSVYYTSALLLFFVPGSDLARGSGAWLLSGIYTPHTCYDYCLALASLALSGATAFLLLPVCSRLIIRAVRAKSYRTVSGWSLAISCAVVISTTGSMGLLVMLVSTGIGLIPVLFHSRRINCLGVILLPMACSMSGIAGSIAGWMGLA